jgi:6-pyruvoyltetrahydropterin/6-carboxytetrahydropterin synthase
MYEVTVSTKFSAAHQLRGYDGNFENLHGHNWTAIVTVAAPKLDAMGVGIDFVMLRDTVDALLKRIDYQNINEVPPFDTLNPSAENIAHWLFEGLAAELSGRAARVRRVEIREFDHSGAAYLGETPESGG